MNVAAYCVVAVESVGRQIPIAFLDRIKEDFNKRYGGGKAATARANSLNREFGYFFFFRTIKILRIILQLLLQNYSVTKVFAESQGLSLRSICNTVWTTLRR